MRTVLMVAEKQSLVSSISALLSNRQSSSRKGSNGACSVHEWNGNFQGESVRFRMTSVCGHVMSLDFIGKYNNWDRVDPAELFSATTEKKEASAKLRMPDFLAREAHGCDYLVLWLDCDKEGENICFEVIDAVQRSMNRLPGRQTIFRSRFSAITEKDIRAAMNNLVEPNENESRSVDARQELDLRIGCAFTRFQTKFFQGRYGDLDSTLISYGPCQTPTLGFCVERHDQIQSYKPEQYWKLALTCELGGGQQINFEWGRVRCFDKEVATMFLNQIKDISSTVVDSVVSKEKAKARPQALNTVELMRVASSGLNMSPHYAMQIAERLYTQGYISYPRTETTHYPENFDLVGPLRQQKDSPVWGAEVRALLSEGIDQPKKGVDVGDHPPITPMRLATPQMLESEAWKVYDYVVRHFIATVHRDCKYLSTTVTVHLGDETFTVTGARVIDPGFTQVMDWLAVGGSEGLPEVRQGDRLEVASVRLTEHLTSPPGYLTESELITLMEKHGIGTDASIPVHINNIGLRNYVIVEAGRKLVPTTLGIVLVHGYQKTDPDLVLPSMRSAVEQQLNLIACQRYKVQYDRRNRVKDQEIKPGYQIWYRNFNARTKMDDPWVGPFVVLCRVGRRHVEFTDRKGVIRRTHVKNVKPVFERSA